MAAIAAMVVGVAIKPYQSKWTPYLKRVNLGSLSNLNLEPSKPIAKDRRNSEGEIAVEKEEFRAQTNSRKKESLPVTVQKPQDKITEKDKTQLKSVLDKL